MTSSKEGGDDIKSDLYFEKEQNGFGLPQKWEANGSRSACGDWKGRGGSWGLNKTSSCTTLKVGK